jgi:secreted trypsin-like serine protease
VFQGDSGGPMSVKDRVTQQHTLVGVNSWGREQCDEVRRDS